MDTSPKTPCHATRGLLVLASDFPPMAGTNTQRVQSFAKYLYGFGWKPYVLTHSLRDLFLIDSGELSNIPDHVEVHRIDSKDPLKAIRRLRGIGPLDLALSSGEGEQEDSPHVAASVANVGLSNKLKSLISAVALRPLSYFLQSYVYIPDANRIWASSIVPYATRLVASGEIQVIMSSSPAYSTHLAALKLKRKTGVPWIAEFRDLWVGRPGRPEFKGWRGALDRDMEASVVDECDHIIVASPAWVDNFALRYGDGIRQKITCITNGYDPEKFPDKPASSNTGSILIVSTGAMHRLESPVPFLMALAQIRQELPDFLANVRVRLAGNAGDEKARLDEIIESGGLSDVVTFLGNLPYRDCLMEQQRADILLLCTGNEHAETIHGRTFEYMATGTPILALIPRYGEEAKLLGNAGTGVLQEYGDIAGTKSAIIRMVSDIRNNKVSGLKPNWEYIRQFDRANLTRRLVEVLDQVSVE